MTKKIKICHVIGSFVNGGVESVIYNYFSHMDLDKFELHIIAHGIYVQECADRFIKLGFKIHNITPKSVSIKKNIKEMEEIFKEYNFDIVHSHMTEWACVPMFLAWKCGVKVRINHSHMAEKPVGLKNLFYYGIRLYLGKIFSTDYYACGRDAGIYLFGKRNIDNGKVTIIPNAIDIEKFQYRLEIRKELRKKLGIDNEKLVIGHVGRFFKQKNHEFLIDIFAAYKKINPDVKLMLFGDGILMGKIKEKVKKLDLDEDVYFMGVRDDIYKWYSVMDAFILPSLYEGLPLVGVEAQINDLQCFFSSCVTDEIAINDNTQFIDLNNSAEKWAEIMNEKMNLVGKRERRNHVDGEDRYNINITAKDLETFYMDVVLRGDK